MKSNIQLPSFHGFYESIWSYMYDDFADEMKYEDFEIAVIKKYSDHYIDLVNSELGLGLVKIGEPELSSPRYYNYESDKIYLDVEIPQLEKLRELMLSNKSELEKIIKEHHTSRDGFISFMSNDFDDWLGSEDDRYISYSIFYLLGIKHGWDIDNEFYELICEEI